MASELELAAILCSLILGGVSEDRVPLVAAGRETYVVPDCLTETHAVEVGLDTARGSLDSVQQAIFYGLETGRLPMVVIIDTDGLEETVEMQIRRVARHLGVSYLTVDEDFLIRWQMTDYFRSRREHLFRAGSSSN